MMMEIIGSEGSFDGLGMFLWALIIGNLVVPLVSCVVTGAFCGAIMRRPGVEGGMTFGFMVGLGATVAAGVWTYLSAWVFVINIDAVIIGLILVAMCGCIATVLVCDNRGKKDPESG